MTNDLSVDQIAALLEATPRMLRSALAEADPALPLWHPAAGEWCINEVLGHLIDTEQNIFAGRLRKMLAQDNPDLGGWSLKQGADRRDCEADFTALLAEFEDLRAESIPLVRALEPEQLLRAGDHPKAGVLQIANVLNNWIYHDYNHTRQILGNVQAYVWPHIGNAQRFYAPDAS